MKANIILFILLITSGKVFSQNTYRTALNNDTKSKVELLQGPKELIIVGYEGDEVIIETNYSDKDATGKSGLKPVDAPPAKEKPDRAAGLKPLAAGPSDNTNIGLTVEKSPGTFTIVGVSPNAMDLSYTIKMPDKAALLITNINPSPKSQVNIKNLEGEINVTVLNTHINIKDVTGPIVANTTNGNIEVSYNLLSPNKPNAITSVNGFVDITLPANTKGQLALNSVNGEAYTDFDIKIDKNNIPDGIPSLQMTFIEGTINGGGSPINISTVNGDIYLRKKK